MLQEKNKNFSFWCIKSAIFFTVFVFLIWSGLIFIIFFILIVLLIKLNLNFTKILDIIWIDDCIDYFIEKFNLKDNKKYREKIFEYRNKFWKKRKDVFPETEYDKKYRKAKPEPDFSYTRKEKNSLEKKDEYKNRINKKNNDIKYNLNNWKSIWDNYESVIDIMNKK